MSQRSGKSKQESATDVRASSSVKRGPPSVKRESPTGNRGQVPQDGGPGALSGGPVEYGGGAKREGPADTAGGVESSHDAPSDMVIPSDTDTHVPIPAPAAPLTDYKGTSLKLVGRDKHGKVIPHKRSEKTARQVAAFVMAGYTKHDVAIALNIRPGLVEECYGKELRHGKDMVGMGLATHIVNRAKQSDRMAIFLAKSQYGYRDGDSKPTDTGLLNIHIHA